MIDPTKLQFTPSHEWVHLDGDLATIGISQFAVDQLTDLTMIDLPERRHEAHPRQELRRDRERQVGEQTCIPPSAARSSRSTPPWPTTSRSSPRTRTPRDG